MFQLPQVDLTPLYDPQNFNTIVAVGVLLIAAFFANFVVKRALLRGVEHILRTTTYGRDKELRKHGVVRRIANTMPLLVISIGVKLIPGLPEKVSTSITNVTQAAMLLAVAMAISGLLSVFDTIYHRKPNRRRSPVKGYFQLGKIAVYVIAAILMVAALTDRSPVLLLSSLGAMAAVLTLVFQDTLLSFVASLQISSNDVVRVGDWISMPSVGADGEVIEVGLHTVKVRNWDHTVTTIPTRKLATDSFANWRGMQESGARRIKRAIHLDQASIRFLDAADLERLSRFTLLREHMARKSEELASWNEALGSEADIPQNTRRQTNLGLLRAYLDAYLRAHPGLNPDQTLMVRQLTPGPQGLPLEIYCFTNTTAWVAYENIQSDIFDHVLAILPEFDLDVFQQVSGSDFRRDPPPAALAMAAE